MDKLMVRRKARFGARVGVVGIVLAALAGTPVYAQDASVATQIADIIVGIDTMWVLMAAFLVFLMQAGFGMLEAGLIRAKNTANILMKNLMDFCMASLGFFIFGYAIMFGSGNPLFGTSGFFLIGAESAAGVPLYAFWLFQAVFVGAAATIVAGGMAERMKFPAYIIYSFLISAFVYPIVGHWIWGGGWLASLGFADFAGSTVVHAVGGWAAFIGTRALGPRIGKFGPDGKPNVISAHSLPLASLGMFLLWFGWFGFNPGSTLGVGDGSLIARVAINTNLAAAAGAIAATATVWLVAGKPDLTMGMNGALAGLVAITAPCAFVEPGHAIIIGLIGGIIVVFGVLFLDRHRVDDPVGAVAVHGMNGIWGTLAVGIWGQSALGVANDGLWFGGGFTQIGIQLLGTVTVSVFIIVVMGLIFKLIDAVVGLRVPRNEELKGLDVAEHGTEAYGGFQVFTTE
jgi:Amt family ammonium transporter